MQKIYQSELICVWLNCLNKQKQMNIAHIYTIFVLLLNKFNKKYIFYDEGLWKTKVSADSNDNKQQLSTTQLVSPPLF